MVKLIKSLENEPSTNKKIELLKNFKDKKLLKEVLFYTLNPEFNYYIKKLPKMVTGVGAFDAGWNLFKAHLNKLNARKVTGNEAIEQTVKWFEAFNPEAQDLCKRILFRDLRCNVSDKIANKVFPKLIPEFKVQLANKYDPNKKYKNEKWAANRKLDGLRAVFKNEKLWTRNGKEIFGFNHIIKELKTLGKFDLVDGELYSHDLGFQTIQGYVLSHKNINENEKKKIFYNIFVLLDKNTTTQKMIEKINSLDKKNSFNYLKFVQYEIIDNDFEKIKELDKKYVEEKFEGVMLRSMDTVYDFKRSDALLKYKSFKEESLKIINIVEGVGKYKGKLGAFVCEGKVEKHNIKTEVGSGFSDEQREEFWNDRKSLIGKLISVKYQNLSDDNSSLRFPIFLGFQLDRQ